MVRCIEMGAEDYLPKSFNPVVLRARLNSSLQKKRLRDLEKMYLRQELMLRQSEKLATLGKLSAGMAHELNNPAAAVLRGAGQLQSSFADLQQALTLLIRANLSPAHLDLLAGIDATTRSRVRAPLYFDALRRADLESDLEDWLGSRGVEDAWEFAPALVSLGLGTKELDALIGSIEASQVPGLLRWITSSYSIYALAEEISEGAGRVSEIVRALKSYSYLDQAPVQEVDLHEGLDTTLVILRSKLRQGIAVHREYAERLPRIEAYGSELNQVWTNLIDNAIDAMNGSGDLRLTTRHDNHWATVEIQDSGPGIPETIQANIFDPFFTTKEPGKGTGLGLSISHSIVVQKHRGQITVSSSPGATRFIVRLPRRLAAETEQA